MYNNTELDQVSADFNIKKGLLVWVLSENSLAGPFIVVKTRVAGYGTNKRKVAMLLDTLSGHTRECNVQYLWAPKRKR